MSKRILGERAVKSLTRLGQLDISNLGKPRILLRKWLLDNHVTVAQFAMMCCMNRRVLDQLLRGEWTSKGGYLQLHQAFAIEWATKSTVPAWLWLDDEFNTLRIRNSRMTQLKDFESRIKSFVLKFNSLAKPEGIIREKARVLSRLFNVQWSEVKRRAWLDAERKAANERPDISYLLQPEDRGPDDDGVYRSHNDQDQDPKSHEAWFTKHFGPDGDLT